LSKSDNIDCLACHDTTGTYRKFPTACGNPPLTDKKCCGKLFPAVDLKKVARHVGPSSRTNCGRCHFYGGGADGVKHGDLDSSLKNPPFEVDVHMSPDGANLQCVDCHTATAHDIPGSRYAGNAKDVHGKDLPVDDHNRASCESCHGLAPHDNAKLNDHVDKVACETCHIPSFARGGVATKTDWDWRTMGKLKDGVGYNEEGYTQGNGEHRHTYKSIKGNFKYDENVEPMYAWFDGKMNYLTIDQKFDPKKQPIEEALAD